MGEITQNVNIEMLEKLPDGNFKIKYPKTIVSQIKDLTGIASQAEAQAGTNNTGIMTPLRVKQSTITKVVEGSHKPSAAGQLSTISLGFQPKVVFCYYTVGDNFLIQGVIKTSTGFEYYSDSASPTTSRFYLAWV